MEVDGVRVLVTRKRVKNLNLRVHPPHGEVRLSAPLRTPDTVIRALVRDRLAWIARHRTRLRKLPRPQFKEYVSGEELSVLGKQHVMRFTSASSAEVPLPTAYEPRNRQVSSELVFRVPLGANRDARKRVVDRWLRRQAKREFAAVVASWEARMNVSVKHLGIKRMKTRWGTCNPTAGRVWLNAALIERGPECLEYVVVHELAHLLVPDHSPAFWRLVERHLPAWREAKSLLDSSPLWLDTQA